MNSVMVEAVNVTAKEKVLLERCQGFLSRVAAMQVTNLLHHYLLVYSGFRYFNLPCLLLHSQTGYRL